MPISWRIGPLTTTIIAEELELDERAESSEAASARITGKYSGRAPAITAFTATCSTENSQAARNSTGCRWPTISSGGWLVALSMASTRSRVGSTIGSLSVQLLSRNSCCRLSSVSGPISPAIGTSMAGMNAVQRRGQRQNHLLHHRPAGDRVVAVDVSGELGRGLAHHRLRHECTRRLGQPGHPGDRRHHFVELVGVQGDGRHAVFGLERDRVGGDGGRAVAAMADADNRRIAVRLDLVPGFWIVLLIGRGQRYDPRLDVRHMRGKPRRNLFEKLDRIVEPAIDQIDRLAVEAFEARRRGFPRNLRWRADRTEDCESLGGGGERFNRLAFRGRDDPVHAMLLRPPLMNFEASIRSSAIAAKPLCAVRPPAPILNG